MSSRRARKRSAGKNRAWAGRAGGIACGLVFLGLVGGYVGVRQYLHSEGFRVMLSEQASDTLGIKGEFSELRWDGLQVDTAGFEAGGDGPVSRLRADNLHTEVGLGKVTSGKWQLRGTNVGRISAELDLRTPKEGDASKASGTDEGPAKAKSGGWLPREAELDQVTVQSVAVKALLDSGAATLAEMKVTAEPEGGKQAYRAVIKGGHVVLPWKIVPPIDIEEVKVRYADKEAFVTNGRAKIGDHGRLQLEGDWSGQTGRHSFGGTVSDLPCGDFLNADWAKRLTGRATTTFALEGKGADSTAKGKLTISDGMLTALPVLDKLAAYADTRRFRELHLDEAHTEWSWSQSETRLDRLVLSSEKLIRLEGSIVIRGQAIDGNFRLGLAPGTLAGIPGAETEVFLPGEGGLNWTPLHVTGTLDDPKEDLSDRLMLAAGMRMFDQIPETGEKVLKFTKQVVGDDPSKVVSQGTKLIGEGVQKTVEEGGKVIEKVAPKVIEGADGLLNKANGVLGSLLGGDDPPPPPPSPAPGSGPAPEKGQPGGKK